MFMYRSIKTGAKICNIIYSYMEIVVYMSFKRMSYRLDLNTIEERMFKRNLSDGVGLYALLIQIKRSWIELIIWG